jgi:hypothetical protein
MNKPYKTANIQTQLDMVVRDKATKKAQEYGFNSLQDAIRIFVYGLANDTIAPSIVPLTYEQRKQAYYAELDELAKNIEAHLNDPIPNEYIAGVAHSGEELIQQLEKYDEENT